MTASACGQENHIHAWDGGHTSTRRAAYGTCSPQNGCNVIGFDCSGLVRYADYQATGVEAPTGTRGASGTRRRRRTLVAVVDGANTGGTSNVANVESQPRPGGIIYGANAGEHVAIYLGGGVRINACGSAVTSA